MEYKFKLIAVTLALISVTEVKCQNFMLIGGSLAKVGEFPYMVRFNSSCTGILISRTHVLVPVLDREVSNCFTDGAAFQAGTTEPWTYKEKTRQISWSATTKRTCSRGDDILTVVDIDGFEITDQVKPISLQANIQFPETGEIVGFPRITRSPQNTNSSWYQQQKLSVNIHNRTYCNQKGYEICTGTLKGGSGTCNDDWKEVMQDFIPLICKIDDKDILCGLLKNGCCGKPHCVENFLDITEESAVTCLNKLIGPPN